MKNRTEQIRALVFWPSVETVEQLGPLPDRIEAVPAHFLRWCDLMKQREPLLRQFANAEILSALNETTCIDCGCVMNPDDSATGNEQCFACFAEHGHSDGRS